MYDSTITLFNYHEKTGKWFPTVIQKADLLINKSRTATTNGFNNGDSVSIIIRCTPSKSISGKEYLSPKVFAKSDNPIQYFTFKPECDFVFESKFESEEDIIDDDYEEGFYHAMNEAYDGVYMITSAAFFGLLPHFEIGGK